MRETGEPPPRTNGKGNGRAVETEPKRVVVETYPYHDPDGVTVYETQRIQFRNPDGSFVLTKEGKPKKAFGSAVPIRSSPASSSITSMASSSSPTGFPI
jgi:hypothetical protein